ncbi:hypothetical protein AAY473_014864 [Plecturocebus cupreus]
MGPVEPVPVRPAHSAPGSAALGAGKRAAPETRVASPPGIARSVGNKNSTVLFYPTFERTLKPATDSRMLREDTTLLETGFHHAGQADLELLTSGDPPPQPPKVLGLQA